MEEPTLPEIRRLRGLYACQRDVYVVWLRE